MQIQKHKCNGLRILQKPEADKIIVNIKRVVEQMRADRLSNRGNEEIKINNAREI